MTPRLLVWKQYISEPPTKFSALNWQGNFLLMFNAGSAAENWVVADAGDLPADSGRLKYGDLATYWARLPE